MSTSPALGGNNTVQIAIQVVDANSSATVNKVRTEIAGLDAETKNLSQSFGTVGAQSQAAAVKMSELGAAGAAAGEQISRGMRRGISDSARLRAELSETGIHVNRVLAAELAQIPMISAAVGAMGTVFMGLGIAAMFEQMTVGAKKFYDENISLNHSLDEYNKKAQEAAMQKLFDTGSLETTEALLNHINRQLDDLDHRRQTGQHHGVVDPNADPGMRFDEDVYTPEDSKKQADLLGRRDTLWEKRKKQQEETAQAKLRNQHEYESAVSQGYAKARAEETALRDEINQRYDAMARDSKEYAARATPELMKRGLIDRPEQAEDFVKASFESQRKQELEHGAIQRRAKEAELTRQATEQEIALHNEAVNAALRGEELYATQRIQQEDAIRRKIAAGNLTRAQGLKEIDDIDLRYHNERLKRLQDEQEATAKMRRQADQSGLVGIAKIQAEGQNRNLETIAAARKSGDFSQLPQRLSINSQMTTSEVEHATQEYYQHLAQMREEYIDAERQGFARIESEARKHAKALRNEFSKTWGGVGASDPGRVAAQQQLDQDLAGVQNKAGDERAKLTRQNAAETMKLEEEAARRSLLPEQQKTQQIVDEYHERLRRYKEMLDDQMISQEDFDRRVIAAQRTMNAELLDQQRQLRDKLAGELQGMFRNPAQWAQGIGEKMAAQFAAALLMKTGAGRGMESALDPRRAVDSITGIFHPKPHGTPPFIESRNAGPQGVNTAQLPRVLQLPGASGSTMSIASAVIHVQNGQIIGGAGGASVGGLMPVGAGGNTPGALGGDFGSAGAMSATSSTLGASTMGGGYTTPNSTGGGVMSNIQGGVGAAQQGYGMLKDLGVFGKSGTSGIGPVANGDQYAQMLGGQGAGGAAQGGMMGTLGGIAGGGMALFGAYKSSGGFGGMMQGALGGAMLGAKLGSFFGPMGTLIGAGIGAIGGAIMGFMGFGGRAKAEAYDKKQVRPRMNDDLQGFEQGSMDYMSAYTDIDNLQAEAKKQCKQFGRGGEGYYDDTIKPELQRAQQKLTREAKAGRAQYTMSAAEFHGGGWIDNFGDLGTTEREGFIHAMQGEFVLHREAAQANSSLLPLMQGGLNVPELLKGAQTMPAMHNSSATFHVNTIDRRGVAQFLDDYKHDIRASLNNSRSEYSGEAEA